MGFSDQINDLLVYGCITDIKVARKIIHTRAVKEAIRSANGSLLMAAPDADEAETDLLRVARTTLAQLRSGYCFSFNTFNHHIYLSHHPVCPSCGQADHTTEP